MNKGLVISALLFSVVVLPQAVFAENSSPSGIRNIKEKVQERIQTIKSNVAERREERVENKVDLARKITSKHVDVLARVATAEGKLLDKLQIRIDKASAAGKDVGSASATMTDARVKLADANTKIADLKTKIAAAKTRADFQAIQAGFKVVRDDLIAVKQDASKIIRVLKGFNSATSSGKNPQAEGTSPSIKK